MHEVVPIGTKTRHRIRHENSFRFGCKKGIKEFSESLKEILPPEYHDDLDKLTKAHLNKREYRYLMRQREATS